MKKYPLALSGLVLAAGAAYAQPTDVPADDHAAPPADGAVPADDAAAPDAGAPDTTAEPAPAPDAASEPAPPADPVAAVDVSDAEIDSFAKATVKLQEIQADATIAEDQKQAAMQAAVAEVGLDPAKYNAIGKAAQADPELRAKVQTAMARHTTAPPSEG